MPRKVGLISLTTISLHPCLHLPAPIFHDGSMPPLQLREQPRALCACVCQSGMNSLIGGHTLSDVCVHLVYLVFCPFHLHLWDQLCVVPVCFIRYVFSV